MSIAGAINSLLVAAVPDLPKEAGKALQDRHKKALKEFGELKAAARKLAEHHRAFDGQWREVFQTLGDSDSALAEEMAKTPALANASSSKKYRKDMGALLKLLVALDVGF